MCGSSLRSWETNRIYIGYALILNLLMEGIIKLLGLDHTHFFSHLPDSRSTASTFCATWSRVSRLSLLLGLSEVRGYYQYIWNYIMPYLQPLPFVLCRL